MGNLQQADSFEDYLYQVSTIWGERQETHPDLFEYMEEVFSGLYKGIDEGEEVNIASALAGLDLGVYLTDSFDLPTLPQQVAIGALVKHYIEVGPTLRGVPAVDEDTSGCGGF